jgi:hypothetical protein
MIDRNSAILSAYTGILFGDFGDFHEYIEELVGRPVVTIEFADPDFAAKIKELSRKDFLNVRDREKRIKKILNEQYEQLQEIQKRIEVLEKALEEV